MPKNHNLDRKTVAGFGDEWQRFDQSALDASELDELFDRYFHIFPWNALPNDAEGFDLGCGSGRWARKVAPRVGKLHCIDASPRALDVAKRNLRDLTNVDFHEASVDQIPLADGSMDFGYSLGVLHHVPDTAAGIRAAVAKLKPNAPFLLYLYYAFDQRPWWFRLLWRLSDLLRRAISRLPHPARYAVSQVLATLVYFPLARISLFLESRGLRVDHVPLSFYRRQSFYTMRTDALDRFGTRLEQRFRRDEIEAMMKSANLEEIAFSEREPFWCAVGRKSALG